MTAYIIRRLWQMVPTMLGVILLVFVLFNWVGGDPAYVLAGKISSDDGERPPELLVAVNGRLAGVAGGYQRDGDAWDFTAYVADFYQSGANSVELYEVEREGAGNPAGTVTLHPVGG